MTLRKIDQLMVKLMQGDPLTQGEGLEAANILAAWDSAQPRVTGAPKRDRSQVALHYWTLRDLMKYKQAAAEKEVGTHWKLAPRSVREIGDVNRDDAREVIAAFVSKPDALIRALEAAAKLAEKQ